MTCKNDCRGSCSLPCAPKCTCAAIDLLHFGHDKTCPDHPANKKKRETKKKVAPKYEPI